MTVAKLLVFISLFLLGLIDSAVIGFAGLAALADGLEQCPYANRCDKAITTVALSLMVLPVSIATCVFSIRAIIRVVSSSPNSVQSSDIGI
jgi:hypothetical protein